MTSLDNIHEIIMDVDSTTHQGASVVDALIGEQKHIAKENFDILLDFEDYCPFLADIDTNVTSVIANDTTSIMVSDLSKQLKSSISQYNEMVNNVLITAQKRLDNLGNSIKSIEGSIEYAMVNDWKPKMFLLVLNVVNLILIGGCIIVRNNIVHYPYKFFLVWLVVPFFIILVMIAAAATSGFGMVVSINSDFCSGGKYPGSPEGTMEEIILKHTSSVQDMPYKAFRYYMTDCTMENPLHFAFDYEPTIRIARERAHAFTVTISEYGLEEASEKCGSNILPLMNGIQRLEESMTRIETNIQKAQKLSSCSTISPILRRILHGPSCQQSVNGMAWMFGNSFFITMMCFIMITVRASLYNATIRKARKQRKNSKEKEWKEYTEYMAQYYDDAHLWKMNSSSAEKKDDHSNEGIPSCGTGVTDIERASVNNSLEESYDSDSSDDTGAGLVSTPCSKSPTFVEQVKTAEKIRTVTNIIDDELLPLSPSAPELIGETDEYGVISENEIDIVDEELQPLSPAPDLIEETDVISLTPTYFLDDELLPLSLTPELIGEIDEFEELSLSPPRKVGLNPNPKAPQKLFKSIKRTSQRKHLW
eukprot:CAMPEP_0194163184 /NCGR_PEP_ID=MMETSP0152-20130528/79904_1 /TAXON_ID=1049557 /ORGANISM="Thalassiothrix antarctica, Strain L6-D1" /LENGTH=590 /DNA_ID=CAMNT_0038873155 /DNA_START=378 /DNA_END=2150 /DNA_ORIENTATION=+